MVSPCPVFPDTDGDGKKEEVILEQEVPPTKVKDINKELLIGQELVGAGSKYFFTEYSHLFKLSNFSKGQRFVFNSSISTAKLKSVHPTCYFIAEPKSSRYKSNSTWNICRMPNGHSKISVLFIKLEVLTDHIL